MSKTDYAERRTLDTLLKTTNTPLTAGNVYVALHTGDPGEASGSNEVTGGSYARKASTFTPAATASGVTTSTNEAELEYTDMPTATITHFSVWDASTSGNMLYSGALTASKALTSGDDLTVSVGAVTVEEQ